MSMIRMFHIACDAENHDNASSDIGDEWYASEAIQRAKDEGYHLRGDKAICPDCWENGTRFGDLEPRP